MKTLKARLFLAIIFGLLASDVVAKIAPDQGRDTLETSHFRIHYPPHYLEFARLLATHLEDAYTVLAPALEWSPRSRTEVVVRGDVDSPQGTAEVFPYNRIVIHAVAPEPWGFFSESDDWVRTLAIHELTHIIANDETSGFFDFLRSFIGTAAKVNPYQPAWLVEGLAVYMETRHTTAGRGRSVWNSMVLRTAFEDGRFGSEITLDRLNDGIPGWPMGHAPYLFGYLINETIARRAGPGGPAAVSSANSRHVPFDIDRVARHTVGAEYAEIWRDVLARLKFDVSWNRALIAQEKISKPKSMTSTGRMTRGAVTIGEKTYYIRDSERTGTGLAVVEPSESGRSRSEDLAFWRWGGGTRLEPTADGRQLLYSRVAPYLEHSSFSDLYLYDIDRDREVQVTTGARAFDPIPSDDFRWDARTRTVVAGALYYTKHLGDGNSGIARLDSEGEKVLYAGKDFERIGAPTLTRSEGIAGWLVFAEKTRRDGEYLRALRIADLQIFNLTGFGARNEIATTPAGSPDGDLFFTSGRGGVFNVRRVPADLLRTALAKRSVVSSERVTNVETGFLQPRKLSRSRTAIEGIVYGPEGWDIGVITEEISTDYTKAFNSENPPLIHFAPDAGTENSSPPKEVASEEIKSSSYSVWPAILPHYWAPNLRRVPDGWTLGVQTSSYDAWEAHRYRLFAGGDTRARFPIWDVNYQFDGFFPTFEFSMRQENRYFATYGESNRIQTTEGRVYTPAGWHSFLVLGFTNQTSQFFAEKESTAGFQLGWIFDRVRVFDDSIDRRGERGVRGGTELTGYFVGAERFSSLASRIELRVPSLFPRHFFRFAAHHSTANNDRLTAHYQLGGGEETIASDRQFLLRGYTPGTIFGREILTSNFEYVFPVVDVFRGWGTFPLFWQTTRMKLFVDAGSAEYVADEKDDLTHWPLGAGMHLLTDLNLFYRVPVTAGIGVDHGFSNRYGGETRFVLGLYSTLARP